MALSMSALAIPSRYKACILGSRSWRWSSLASKACNRMSIVGVASGSSSGSGSGCGWWRLLGLVATEQNLWKYEKSKVLRCFLQRGYKNVHPCQAAKMGDERGINCPTSITRPISMVYEMVARPFVRSDTWEHGDMLACTSANPKRAKG